MSASFSDFIGVFEDAFTSEYCDAIVARVENAFKSGFGNARNTEEYGAGADDFQLFSSQIVATHILSDNQLQHFNKVFWEDCYSAYSDKYRQLKNLAEHYVYGVKIQRTGPTQGYHMWHSEHSNAKSGSVNRVLAWLVYLNDVEDGGETEFLYQSRRVKPKKGTLVLWPAGFTHTHRGNPPLSGNKYIMTGWVEY